jgi:hypothetical protein
MINLRPKKNTYLSVYKTGSNPGDDLLNAQMLGLLPLFISVASRGAAWLGLEGVTH